MGARQQRPVVRLRWESGEGCSAKAVLAVWGGM